MNPLPQTLSDLPIFPDVEVEQLSDGRTILRRRIPEFEFAAVLREMPAAFVDEEGSWIIDYHLSQEKHMPRYASDVALDQRSMGTLPRKIWELNPQSLGKPCKYCGRTGQNPKHESCDGCGAPRLATPYYGYGW